MVCVRRPLLLADCLKILLGSASRGRNHGLSSQDFSRAHEKDTLSGDFRVGLRSNAGRRHIQIAISKNSHAAKIECGGGGSRRSSRPRKRGVEDRYNQDRGDDQRGEGHHSSSPFASDHPSGCRRAHPAQRRRNDEPARARFGDPCRPILAAWPRSIPSRTAASDRSHPF